MDTIGSRLKWAREQRGLTQAALARTACVLTHAIGQLEDGQRPPPSDVSSLANALGVSAAWLATGRGEWRPAPVPGVGGQPSASASDASAAAALGATIVQLGLQLALLSPMARSSIAPLLAQVAQDPACAAEAARIADAIASR
jgi:transcriptional regulator with XRE-family HTH domain